MDNWYSAFMGLGPDRIPHWEHWSCPDAESYITGIDHYDHPRQCRERMRELYPFINYDVNMPIPANDDPWPKPMLGNTGQSVRIDEDGNRHVRWGDTETRDWDFGKEFTAAEDIFAYSPLEANPDIFDDEKLYAEFRIRFPSEWGDKAPEHSSAMIDWYNTMIMWPLLTFGWEWFLETCLDPRFDRLMEEFAELNRHIFAAYAKLPVNFILCHDDIAGSSGPYCSPAWMRKHIFPRYEEFWSMLKAAGKEVLFMSDGNVDAFVDDIFACGARGIISEPYVDYKSIARRYENCFIAGEGDNRVLMRNDPAEIKAMVESMVETAKMSGGYMMCVGNHIPWNVPPEAVKYYLDLSSELGYRGN